jgi:hypothetical protein
VSKPDGEIYEPFSDGFDMSVFREGKTLVDQREFGRDWLQLKHSRQPFRPH